MITIYEQQHTGYRFIDENKEHLHVLDGRPLLGTTTVLEILSKPLTYWASGKACEQFGWISQKPYKKPAPSKEEIFEKARVGHEYVKALSLEDYVKHLDKAYRAFKASSDEAADKGTELHAMVEVYIKGQIDGAPPLFDEPQIQPFVEWSKKNVRRFLWAELCHYSSRLWVGGKSDFGYEDMEGRIVLGDIKSSKDAYLSHFLQAGAYSLQISENGLFNDKGQRLFKLSKPIDYFAIFPFGGGFKEPSLIFDTKPYQDGFEAAVILYKLKQAFEGE